MVPFIPMNVLGLESTCDETAAAVVVDGIHILSEEMASSASIHAAYGGVFPEMACRHHVEMFCPVLEKALEKGGVSPQDIDLIAVPQGPGLVGALLIGMQMAKGLSIAWKKPFIGVNHVEAHLVGAMLSHPSPPIFPALGLVVSGGHTLLLYIETLGVYKKIGTTLDDALGEAFDKVAVLLGFPYPGGPHVEKLAKEGSPTIPFKSGTIQGKPFDFSFSGIKTSVLYAVRENRYAKETIAASFQEAVLTDLVQKTQKALLQYPTARALYFGGGVVQNRALQQKFIDAFSLPLFFPTPSLASDNAAMIAALGFQKFRLSPTSSPLDMEVLPKFLPIG